jgi:hypothetical protein
MVTEHQDPPPSRPIEAHENSQIESLCDRDQEQDLHAGRMEARYPKVNEISWDEVYAEHIPWH